MEDLYDLQASVFVTDTEDQDSLDERIDSEQRLRNQQLWASFQNAACCITKLYKDRTQPNVSPWVPFQNAASNLTTLYKDCIESQRNFARIGYQIGRRRRYRELAKLLKKHKIPATVARQYYGDHSLFEAESHATDASVLTQTTPNANVVSSILDVNQLNLDCDDVPTQSMQAQHTIDQPRAQQQLQHSSSQHPIQVHQQQQAQVQNISHQSPQSAHLERQQQQHQQQSNLQSIVGGNDEDLLTFQQALAQTASKSVKMSQSRKSCPNSYGYMNNQQHRAVEVKSEEDRLLELNQFLTEEYHRHVGSRKRSCSSIGGGMHIKRFRE